MINTFLQVSVCLTATTSTFKINFINKIIFIKVHVESSYISSVIISILLYYQSNVLQRLDGGDLLVGNAFTWKRSPKADSAVTSTVASAPAIWTTDTTSILCVRHFVATCHH